MTSCFNETMQVLKVSNLKKSFKAHFYSPRVEILKNLSFEVPRGTVTGFLGANGSGKTTTLKAMLRLIYPDHGEIEILGSKEFSLDVKRRIGFLPERPYFYEYLTGREFLRFHSELAGVKGLPCNEIEMNLERVGLGDAGDKELRSYSKGMLQRIGIAQAIIHRPELVILDEPMTGLDPDGRAEICAIIREISKQGATLFFSSHLLHDVELLCDHLVILRAGELIYQGPTRDLISQVKGKIQITWRTQDKEFVSEAEDLQSAQQLIDQQRAQGNLVVEVRKLGVSLEEIFVKMAIKK